MARQQYMSLREYAKSRGITAPAVSLAIRKGRLVKSVVFDEQGAPKIRDAELADREWQATTDLSRAPGYVKERADQRAREAEQEKPSPSRSKKKRQQSEDTEEGETAHLGMTLSEASAAEKVWKARIAELDYKERCGELVNAKDISDKLANVFTLCRTKLLGVPSRAKQALPHLTVQDLAEVERIVREALEDLATIPIVGEEEAPAE